MFKPVHFLIGLIIMVLMAGTALAQGPVTPRHTDPDWQASYWNNTSLSGSPVLQRTETNLDYDWGTGVPAPGVNADQFSARWSRYIDLPPATYRFSVTADDGIRLWVDDELLIDQWRDQGATTYTAQKYLGSGHHLVRLEYYENFGAAVAKISWTQSLPPIQGWHGEYFNNKSLSGPPALVRDDPQINFNWGANSPAPGQVDADGFSARWSQSPNLPAGNYHFTMTVDDGARLFVNGHLLIDAWKDQAPKTYFGDIYLPGGSVLIQMEYYENAGGAVAQLSWASADNPPPPPSSDPTGSVTAYRLNVRSGPGLDYSILGRLNRGEQVHLLGRNEAGTWLKVEARQRRQGWVYAYYIRSDVPINDLPVIQ